MLFIKHQYTTQDLINDCLKGKRAAQELLYKQFASKMMAVCMRYAIDRPEAEDMLQIGFVKIFNKLESYRGDGNFEGWVRRIIVHSAIEYYRKHHKMLSVEVDDDLHAQAINPSAAANLDAKDLMAMIQTLAPGYRMVFNLYAIEGYSHKEIGEIMGITEGASKSQLSRARVILKEQIIKLEGRNYEYAG